MPEPTQPKKSGQLATRIHGYWIHPFKDRPGRKKKRLTLRFVFPGSIPGKKQNQLPIPVFDIPKKSKLRPDMPAISANAFAQQCFRDHGCMTLADLAVFKDLTSARIVPGTRYREWNTAAHLVLADQMAAQLPLLKARDLIYPFDNCSIVIYHQWKDMTVRDLGNRQESLMDLFGEAKLIVNDSDFVVGPIKMDAGRYKGEIIEHATIVYLTAYY